MPRQYLVECDLSGLGRQTCDVLVVGSGVAGLSCALAAANTGKSVILLTKDTLQECNTAYAQGGIAAALAPDDTPEAHAQDTFAAGAGLCDEENVNQLVHLGPQRVLELIAMGAHFDQENGVLALGREAAHRSRRIAHARGDATGREIHETLSSAVVAHEDVRLLENALLVDVLTHEDRCVGALVLVEGQPPIIALAHATVLATGGIGAIYARTTNPPVATGDGMAAAYRAGCGLMDMEFVQFHPTALATNTFPAFLISEAVRGEGAILRDLTGHAFMREYDPAAELAPRDVVARSIATQMRKTGAPHVLLDFSPIGTHEIENHFPTILRTCLSSGLDPRKEPIPVAPAAHYTMGGIRVSSDSRTYVPGLYASGECACTGIHGANRLASNSLLEGLVFGSDSGLRAAELTDLELSQQIEPPEDTLGQTTNGRGGLDPAVVTRELRELMWSHCGIVRTGQELREAIAQLDAWRQQIDDPGFNREAIELCNMLCVARAAAVAALRREESRGAHYRSDFPETNDHDWRCHIVLSLDVSDFRVEG